LCCQLGLPLTTEKLWDDPVSPVQGLRASILPLVKEAAALTALMLRKLIDELRPRASHPSLQIFLYVDRAPAGPAEAAGRATWLSTSRSL